MKLKNKYFKKIRTKNHKKNMKTKNPRNENERFENRERMNRITEN